MWERKKTPITHKEFNRKTPTFWKLKWDFFPIQKVFADFPNFRTLILPEVHLKKFWAKSENIFGTHPSPITHHPSIHQHLNLQIHLHLHLHLFLPFLLLVHLHPFFLLSSIFFLLCSFFLLSFFLLSFIFFLLSSFIFLAFIFLSFLYLSFFFILLSFFLFSSSVFFLFYIFFS